MIFMRNLKTKNQEVMKLPNFMFNSKLHNRGIKLSKILINIRKLARAVKKGLSKCFLVVKQ